ncbi:UNVERIFIED_CONTAM: hypothetical protein Sradi_0739200 [Sesamum radiatum]|uniref:Reverse transcriptase domain-containing protein n=1 Tax=Sesamum radiatum TaxID=300843 RepID=A0AAW2VSQ9_SESRA
MLQEAERRVRVQGVTMCVAAPRISHLMYADDTSLFCEATDEQIQEIQRILMVYERASGQEVNFAKSSMMVNGIIEEEEKRCLASRGSVSECPESLFGFPRCGWEIKECSLSQYLG